MYIIRHIIILFLIIISLIVIDEGKDIMLSDDNNQIDLNHNQNRETDIPYQYIFTRNDDDVKWISSNSCDLSCSSGKLLFCSYYSIIRTIDYTGIVWQPPETL